MNETTCTRCGHKLTSDKSIARGYGPTCARKIRNAAKTIEGFKPFQIEKAEALIFDRTFTFLYGKSGALDVLSSNRTDHYFTETDACTCPAGLRGRPCYHVAAARILKSA